MVGIYKIENIVNGKVYIGQSTNLKSRKIHHKSELRCKRHPNLYLQNAFCKYGEGNFRFEIIEKVDEQNLDEREIYWINYYNSTNEKYGYNLESGGKKYKHHNERSKEIMSIKSKNAIRTQEWRNKIGLAHKGKIISEQTKLKLRKINLGKTHSNETKEKISKRMKGDKNRSAKLTNKEVRHIKMSMYLDMSKYEILKLFGISNKTFCNIKGLNNWNHVAPELNHYIKNRNKLNKQLKIEEIIKLRNIGLTPMEIHKKLNIPTTTLYRILKEVGDII
ncbi:GIY-YIG nuclease family protein [Clostridium botulinum]|uniref:GIY-YIG nuclease family protein n=1 Tax=Clostridium botulinum TaxID=1491 RepID=UPI0004670E86|nr:GIY-YIG nuclease family protein [Clostridium botulinum]APQ72279.1 group I intron endonuclease family protein [Clostridium botulinum]